VKGAVDGEARHDEENSGGSEKGERDQCFLPPRDEKILGGK
jgi:hypothetical protein